MKFVNTVLIVMTGTSACATLAEFRLIGWDESGEYLAWEQHGWSDGAGLPWAELSVMHVPSGATVYRADSFPTEGTGLWEYCPAGNPVRAVLLERAAPLLDSLGIEAGNAGTLLVHHPVTDFTTDAYLVRFHGWAASVDYHGPEYLLELVEHESGEPQVPDWYPSPVLLELRLEQAGGDTVTLVSESEPAPGYRSVFGYRIRDVITYRDRFVAVVLNTVIPGFEGADGAFRLVSGVLPGSRPLMP